MALVSEGMNFLETPTLLFSVVMDVHMCEHKRGGCQGSVLKIQRFIVPLLTTRSNFF